MSYWHGAARRQPSKYQMLHDKGSPNKIIIHFLWKVDQKTNYLHFLTIVNKKKFMAEQNIKGLRVISD